MRGRKPKRVKAPRARRTKIVSVGRPRIYTPFRNNMTGVLLEEGPEQSIIYYDDDGSNPYLIREWCLPNEHIKRGVPRVRVGVQRVRIKEERVRLKLERVRLRDA